MKSNMRLLITVTCCMLSTLHVRANIWRVNDISNYNGTSLWGDNVGGNATRPVFKKIQEAIDATTLVQNFDTIHIEGALNVYAGFTTLRPLVFIGAGYFLAENNALFGNVSNNPLLETRVNGAAFLIGADYSQVMGVNFIAFTGSPILSIDEVSHITVKRCKITASYMNISNDPAFTHDIYIVQNFFSNVNAITSSIRMDNYTYSNIYINNNIFQMPVLLGTQNFVEECKNNVFDFAGNSGASPVIAMNTNSFKNNIIKTANAVVNINGGAVNGNITHNYFVATAQPYQFDVTPQYNNAALSTAEAQNLFIAAAATTDGNYRLRTGTVYNNTGTDNTDRGAYGGASVPNRYTISGLANIPVIYDIITSGVTDNNGLPVTIKARTIQ